jgi:hypothetical protein
MFETSKKRQIRTFFAGLVSSSGSSVFARFLAPRVRLAGGPAGEGATVGGTEASFLGIALGGAFLAAAFFLVA